MSWAAKLFSYTTGRPLLRPLSTKLYCSIFLKPLSSKFFSRAQFFNSPPSSFIKGRRASKVDWSAWISSAFLLYLEPTRSLLPPLLPEISQKQSFFSRPYRFYQIQTILQNWQRTRHFVDRELYNHFHKYWILSTNVRTYVIDHISFFKQYHTGPIIKTRPQQTIGKLNRIFHINKILIYNVILKLHPGFQL